MASWLFKEVKFTRGQACLIQFNSTCLFKKKIESAGLWAILHGLSMYKKISYEEVVMETMINTGRPFFPWGADTNKSESFLNKFLL